MNSNNKTFVTGIGVVSCLGSNYNDHKMNLLQMNSGIKYKTFKNSNYSFSSYVGSVSKESLLLNEFKNDYDNLNYSMNAVYEAIKDANINFEDYENIGLILGTSLGGKTESQKSYYKFLSEDYAFETEKSQKKLLQNLADEIVKFFNIKANVHVISTACSASNNAVILGSQMIQSGNYDLVIAGGSDSLADISLAGFNALGALKNNSIATPYSNEYGINLGEGAGFIVLEGHKSIKSRNIKCEIVSGSISSDSHHITSPDPKGSGAKNVIENTINRANIKYDQIDYINSHGTGTKANDTMELNKLRNLFDKHTLISSTKSLTGHTLGAAGIIELINTIIMMENSTIVGTLTNETIDNKLASSFLINNIKRQPINYALNLSFAFGGNNSCVLLAKHKSDYITKNSNYSLNNYGIKHITSNAVLNNTLINPSNNPNFNTLSYDNKNYFGYEYNNLKNKYKLNPNIFRRIDSFSKLIVNTVAKCFIDADIDYKKLNHDKVGILFSTPMGPIESVEKIEQDIHHHGYSNVSAKVFPYTVMNAAAGVVSQMFKTKGPVSVISSIGTGYIDCMNYAKYFVENEDIDYLLLINATKISKFELFNWFETGYASSSHLTDFVTTTLLQKNFKHEKVKILDTKILNGNDIVLSKLIDEFLIKNKVSLTNIQGVIWNKNKKIDCPEFYQLQNFENTIKNDLTIYNLNNLNFTSDGSGEELVYLYQHINTPGKYLLISYSASGGFALFLAQINI
ncbi:beta-ketoacyl synthase N-terminal-like domain-containing protein [Staphylococcus pasteuri]|uniref:beta-ketoacyl-[acyl-carrier-protein] synthase family protein n=1 Tax=Staphylococcus pasteuri TaxID=45972 RepID=UPI003D04F7E4